MTEIIRHPIFYPSSYGGWVNSPLDLQKGWIGDEMENDM